ncbi:MAG TPA: MBL fold metallo-hydrolase [Flavobacteriales bacterium]|nr:MBL fold metallo-hydrolase [Flavobacteriales bacterium]
MAATIKITVLGSGTSQGVPVIACRCAVCNSANPNDNRLRSSILVESPTTSVVIDSGPDFRQQMLKFKVKKLDAVLFTHEHKDHIAGLDDVRAFNFIQQSAVDIYGRDRVLEALKTEFHYAFTEEKYPGVPILNLIEIKNETFRIGDIDFTPIEVMHYKLPVFGFRIRNFTYVTDANFIAEREMEKIKGSEILMLNALRIQKHISHYNLEEALEVAQQINANETYFTHISHLLGLHEVIEEGLPPKIKLAYDGQVFTV